MNKHSLLKYHAMKTYGGVEVQLNEFLTSEQNGGMWQTSRPGRLNPEEGARYPLGGLQSRSGPRGEEKNFLPLP
jgi:hypothetical protein